ncbi:RNaseH domain-containing protein [Kitasatospora sp. NPDC085895]|uniref:RNaseH domain-containing protein n=1 Tax=Kitasatospora sp. NPDC085895 TaxID=3155057 RepID=UPI00344CF564
MARSRDLTAPTTTILCTEALLKGMTAQVWEFSEITQQTWKGLEGQARDARKQAQKGDDRDLFLLPYSIVVNVLQQITDGYVYLDKYLRFMVALDDIEPKALRKVFTYLEGIVRGIPVDEIPLRVESELADLVANTDSVTRDLADVILPAEGAAYADPPSWAYQAVRWHLAKKLAAVPFIDREIEPVKKPEMAKDANGKPLKDEDGNPVPRTDEAGNPVMRTGAWKPTGNTATLRYRPDSSGDLIAWDHPIGPTFAKLPHPLTREAMDAGYPENPSAADAQYSLSRISVGMSTHHGRPEPVINLGAHMRRVNDTLVWSKTIMVDRATGPVLLVSLDGRKLNRTNRLALEILAKLDADATALETLDGRVRAEIAELDASKGNNGRVRRVTEKPGMIRPLIPKQRSFQVGSGAGLHHHELLHEFAARALGDKATFLALTNVPGVFSNRIHSLRSDEKKQRKEAGEFLNLCALPTPAAVRDSIQDQDLDRLLIVCLWYREETRLRMISALAFSNGADVDMDPTDGEIVALADGVEAVFVRATRLLAHGTEDGRIDAARDIVDRYAKPGVMIAAWCETEIPGAGEKHKGMKPAEVRKDLADNDAKFQVRRAFATETVPSQNILGIKTTYDKAGHKVHKVQGVPKDRNKDHPAFMGLLDLYRSCGVIDERYEQALYAPGDSFEIPRIAFVGLHVRRQGKSALFRGEPKRVVMATCFIPPTEPGGQWRMLGWSNLAMRWEPYRVAQAECHALNYPNHSGTGDGTTDVARWAEAGRDINECLKDLVLEELDGMPYTVMLDGHGARRIFPGLHNNKQGMDPFDSYGRVWLPGHGLPDYMQPAGIVRVNCMSGEMPSIAYLSYANDDRIKMSSELFRPSDAGPDSSWWVVTEPRNYGKTRFGQWKTRWRALPEKVGTQTESELKAPWYSMTCREITPMFVRGEGLTREGLAVATARMCDQALSWSDRTKYPAPLHAALQMDLDHPNFRRSAPREYEDRTILSEAVEGLDLADSD